MLTTRHIERLWDAGKYERLLGELIALRVEGAVEKVLGEQARVCSAAFGLIRLDEVNQPHAAVGGKLVRALIAGQGSGGGWGEIMTTALCLRALSLSNGNGEAIDRGIGYLARLQQQSGLWPRLPMGRVLDDALVSAFTLLQLGDQEKFRRAVRFEAAVGWFESHLLNQTRAAQSLWDHARVRSAGMTAAGGLFGGLS